LKNHQELGSPFKSFASLGKNMQALRHENDMYGLKTGTEKASVAPLFHHGVIGRHTAQRCLSLIGFLFHDEIACATDGAAFIYDLVNGNDAFAEDTAFVFLTHSPAWVVAISSLTCISRKRPGYSFKICWARPPAPYMFPISIC